MRFLDKLFGRPANTPRTGPQPPQVESGALRRVIMIMAAQELAATNAVPPCPWIARTLRSKWVLVDDVWDHLADCGQCQAGIAARLAAAHLLAIAGVPDCEWVSNRVASSSSFPEQEIRRHKRDCSTCQEITRLRVCCASVVAISDYIPGCQWLELRFRESMRFRESTCTPDEIRQHFDCCAVCRTRIMRMEAAG